VLVDPLIDGALELLNKRSRVDSQPANVFLVLHLVDVVLNCGQELDLAVEFVQVGYSCNHASQDLLLHTVERLDLVLIMAFVLIGVSSCVEVLDKLLFQVFSCSKERLEGVIESLLPKEFLLVVLADESISCCLNFIDISGDGLDRSEKLELVLDLNEVITSVDVKTWHLDGNGNEVVNDLVDDVDDSCAS